MTTYGTVYGGWKLPNDISLNNESIIISVGVGEDISFDLTIQSKFNCLVYMIDPTERSIKHVEEVKRYFLSHDSAVFTGNIQPDYISCIKDAQPIFSKISMDPVGLWNKDDTLKFYKQDNPNYVSQTLIPNMYGKEYTKVNVVRLKHFLENKGLSEKPIDILKLDIEGAELEVLETLIEDKIFPRFLCVEFDYLIKGKDKDNRTKNIITKLLNVGYDILYNIGWNITFKLNSLL